MQITSMRLAKWNCPNPRNQYTDQLDSEIMRCELDKMALVYKKNNQTPDLHLHSHTKYQIEVLV